MADSGHPAGSCEDTLERRRASADAEATQRASASSGCSAARVSSARHEAQVA